MILQADDDVMGLRFWARGQQKAPLASLTTDPGERTSFALFGQGDEATCTINANEAGVGAISLRDKNDRRRIRLGLDPHGRASIEFFNRKGESIWLMPTDE